MSEIQDLEPATQIELEAAAFRTLVAHLRERTDVQNIDLMTVSYTHLTLPTILLV